MRYLGIDFGTKHIGISISDESGTLAFPHATFSNDKELVANIVKLMKEKGVIGAVIGESKDFKGKDNPVMEKARAFAKTLEQELIKEDVEASVSFEPEFMTSVEARHIQGGNEKTHASASAIILQSFLDKRKNNS
jgi:putative Holliday junction resolvase